MTPGAAGVGGPERATLTRCPPPVTSTRRVTTPVRACPTGGARARALALMIGLAGLSLGVAACSNASTSGSATTSTTAAPTTSTAPAAPSKNPSLTLADNHRTIAVLVPATIKVSLPYDPADKESWQLVSGGAGFAMIGSPTFVPPTTAGGQGTEVLAFLMAGHATLPLTLDYAKPGTVPAKPAQRFSVDLAPS